MSGSWDKTAHTVNLKRGEWSVLHFRHLTCREVCPVPIDEEHDWAHSQAAHLIEPHSQSACSDKEDDHCCNWAPQPVCLQWWRGWSLLQLGPTASLLAVMKRMTTAATGPHSQSACSDEEDDHCCNWAPQPVCLQWWRGWSLLQLGIDFSSSCL
jgi:hypothetical protein